MPRPPLIEIADLLRQASGNYPQSEIDEINRAYELARRAHEGQRRASGEAYIYHPLAVAQIVLQLGMDYHSVIAALLHDVLEDTEISREEISTAFGESVAHMVDGLSKLTHLKVSDRREAQAVNFRKMVLAMVDDIRIIVVKLADRLHNMRTLGAVRTEQRRRISRETLEVFAPIAHRLGIEQLKNELENLGFKGLYPARYRVLGAQVQKARQKRQTLVTKIEVGLKAFLDEVGIEADIQAREKHLYSLYTKMKSKQLPFAQVYDMFGLRVVVNNVEDCYRALWVLHMRYRPRPEQFRDYIAVPKENGYQSLHTVLIAREGVTFEAQIRNREMNQVADSGIAAHWQYKSGETNAVQRRMRAWVSRLIDMQAEARSPLEFYENAKLDLFPDEIYVNSPKGDIYRLPKGATAIDFAFAVHSAVGEHCVGAKIDGQVAPVSAPLYSGQMVEIATGAPNISPFWLNYVVTARARTAIRQYLRGDGAERARGHGKNQLRRALQQRGRRFENLTAQTLSQFVQENNIASVDTLLLDIALNTQQADVVAEKIAQIDGASEVATTSDTDTSIVIDGEVGEGFILSACCRPIPGDRIQGFHGRARRVVVHRVQCPNIRSYARRPDDWVSVEWSSNMAKDYHADVMLEMKDIPGALARVTAVIETLDINIEDLQFQSSQLSNKRLLLSLSVHDRTHLAQALRRLRAVPQVQKVRREMG